MTNYQVMFLANDGGSDLQDFRYTDVIWAFFVLCVLIVGIVLLLRFLSNKNRVWMSDRGMNILGTVGLGQNKSLQMIEIGHTLYLIGVGVDIQLVARIDDPDEIRMIKEMIQVERQHQNSWLPERISAWLGQRKPSVPNTDQTDPTVSFEQLFSEQRRRMASRNEQVEQLLKRDHHE